MGNGMAIGRDENNCDSMNVWTRDVYGVNRK